MRRTNSYAVGLRVCLHLQQNKRMNMLSLTLLKRALQQVALCLVFWAGQGQAETYQLDFSLLGAPDQITLHGVEDNETVWFGVPDNLQVEDLRLNIRLAHSEALLPDLSHLTVYLNDQLVETIDLNKDVSSQKEEYSLSLPVTQLKPMNQLRFHQVAHYTQECEDPLHASLWTELQSDSNLEVKARARPLPNDLSLLPVPFFDPKDGRRQSIALVLAKNSQDNVQAAGILASWFGALSGYRGVDIQLLNHFPKEGSAIAIGTHAELAALGTHAGGKGASLMIQDAPNAPMDKLLTVSGQTGQEVVTAAKALALGGDFLSGAEATDLTVSVQPRQAYDAPNWLPINRPVKFGELVEPEALITHGYKPRPINMHLRLPPDLYAWRNDRVPLTVKYRPARNVQDPGAFLSVDIGQAQLKTIKFNEDSARTESTFGTDALPLVEKSILVPLNTLSTRATLSFSFYYPTPSFNECENLLADNVVSGIDPDSVLDLSGMMHHLAMPNMGVFFDAGYPFSRMADLSETAVLLQASDSDVKTFLLLMVRIGQSTGYPATEVQVLIDPKTDQGLADKDLLLIGGGGSLGLLEQWKKYLPAKARGKSGGQTVMSGFRSPLNSNRHVVVVMGDDSEQTEKTLAGLLKQADLGAAVQGSVVAVAGDQVDVLSTKTTYYTGHLGWQRGLQFFLGQRPWVLALLFIMGISLASIVAYVGLRARARSRLRATGVAEQ